MTSWTFAPPSHDPRGERRASSTRTTSSSTITPSTAPSSLPGSSSRGNRFATLGVRPSHEEEALHACSEARTLWLQLGNLSNDEIESLRGVASVFRALGRPEDALETHREALSRALDHGLEDVGLEIVVDVAETLSGAGAFERALELALFAQSNQPEEAGAWRAASELVQKIESEAPDGTRPGAELRSRYVQLRALAGPQGTAYFRPFVGGSTSTGRT